MSVSHEPWLVALSLVVAFQGSFVGLSLSVQVTDAVDPRRRLLLAGAALTLALAIWSMHFVGMLAAQLPVAVDFLVLPTLLSFLVCVLVVGLAVFAASHGSLTALRLGLSALVMGAGICIMHYLGMYALHASSNMSHDPVYIVASFLVAFNAAGLALWLSFGVGRQPPMVVSALVLALAISAMHYTAMAGMTLTPRDTVVGFGSPSVSPGTLAIVVACVAFLVSGLFLLALVPAREEAVAGSQSLGSDFEAAAQSLAANDVDAEMQDAISAEAGEQAAEADAKRPPAGLQAAPGQRGSSGFKRTLPVERDGVKCQIGIQDVVSVQADAHYTQLFDGTRTLFCPLAISEVERLLDPKLFSRVHRSHIVNLTRVDGYKRAGDSGVLTLQGEEPHQVPVSRSRWSRVKARLVDRDDRDNELQSTAAAQ